MVMIRYDDANNKENVMKTQITDDLRVFHLYLGEQLANGADRSPEEAVDS